MPHCPSCRSSLHPGKVKKGLDGRMWESRPYGKTYRWYRKVAPSKAKPLRARPTKKQRPTKMTIEERRQMREFKDENAKKMVDKFIECYKNCPDDEHLTTCITNCDEAHLKPLVKSKTPQEVQEARAKVQEARAKLLEIMRNR